MANHKSAEKRIRVSKRRRKINKSSISKEKTLLKKVFNNSDKTETEQIYKEAISHLDKLVAKGRIHKNNAARKKSRLTRYLNSLSQTVDTK